MRVDELDGYSPEPGSGATELCKVMMIALDTHLGPGAHQVRAIALVHTPAKDGFAASGYTDVAELVGDLVGATDEIAIKVGADIEVHIKTTGEVLTAQETSREQYAAERQVNQAAGATHVLTVTTRVPSKWRLADCETGEIYEWDPDGPNMQGLWVRSRLPAEMTK